MSAERLLERLDKVKPVRGKHPQNWVACCPSHDDKTPSLAVSETADGQVLINCWAGCTWKQIAEAAGVDQNELFARELERPERKYHPRSEMDAVVDEYCRTMKGATVSEAILLFCKAARKSGQRLTQADLDRELEAKRWVMRRGAA